MNATLGLAQLKYVHQRNAKRGEIVSAYREQLARISGLGVPFSSHQGDSAYHLMPVLLPESASRHDVMSMMRDAGLQTSVHYRSVDTFTAYVNAGLGPSTAVPLSHAIGERVVTLPLYPSMRADQVGMVCDTLGRAVLRATAEAEQSAAAVG